MATGTADIERIERIKRVLKDKQLDGIVVRIPENILYFSGYLPSMGVNNPCAFVTQDGDVSVMASYEDEIFVEDSWADDVRRYPAFPLEGDDPKARITEFIRDEANKHGISSGRIAYEGSFEVISTPLFCGIIAVPSVGNFYNEISLAVTSAHLVDGSELIMELRGAKTPYELEKMRKTAKMTAKGNLACKERLHPGMTEAEIAVAVESAITLGGADIEGAKRWRGFAHVATGQRTGTAWSVMYFNTHRKVKESDLVVIELHGMLDGYWSDLTRTYSVGKPTQKQREIWEVVAEAQKKAMEADKPGATGQEVDAAARKVITEAGYGEYFPHHTGHGSGLRSHEPPFLHPNVEGVVLPEGACHSCEPGIYIKDQGIGLRIEDIVETTPDGAKYLWDHDRNLD